jgi:hypothetical protein
LSPALLFLWSKIAMVYPNNLSLYQRLGSDVWELNSYLACALSLLENSTYAKFLLSIKQQAC